MENIDWSPLIEVVVTAFIGVLTVAIPLLFGIVKSYLLTLEGEIESRVGENTWYEIKDWASVLINAAQQKADLDTDEKKKEFVLEHLVTLTENYGVPVNESQLDALIEGILAQMKIQESLAADNTAA